MSMLKNFMKDESGLVTVEWVGLTAAVCVAGIVIAWAIMTGANTAGTNVTTTLTSAPLNSSAVVAAKQPAFLK